MKRRFAEACKRKDLKVNVRKDMGRVLGEEDIVDGRQLERLSDFKSFRSVLDESSTDGSEYCMKVASHRISLLYLE